MLFEPLWPSANRWGADNSEVSFCTKHDDAESLSSIYASVYVNHIHLPTEYASVCKLTTTSTVCAAFFLLLMCIDVHLAFYSVCLLFSSNLLNKVWWNWWLAGVRWDSATTKVAQILCNHQACTHVPRLRVSQYMEQMAGRVLNKHICMLIISLGYSQLLLPILLFAIDVW